MSARAPRRVSPGRGTNSRADDVDHAVRELGHLRPRLRPDLRFTHQVFRDAESYVIEDPVHGRFFRVGLPEFRFAQRLDGETSIADVLAAMAREFGGDAPDEFEAAVMLRWLIDNELAVTDALADIGWLREAAGRQRRKRRARRLNPLFIRVPLVDPDRFLDRLHPLVGWLFSPWLVGVWLLVVLSGAWQVSSNFDRFLAVYDGLFDSLDWLWLLVAWIALKVVHETGHGIVCKRYGGEVREAGVILVLLLPIGYVDATSSWRFPSKWQRIHTAAAGMYIELFIAGAAAWYWAGAGTGLAAHLAAQLVLLASINTLLFNANPLMKFDGYYILSDWLGLPGLYRDGQRFVHGMVARLFAGMRRAPLHYSAGDAFLVAFYGIAAGVWRLIVVVTLLLIASTLFHGAGLLLALAAIVALLAAPVARIVSRMQRDDAGSRPSWLRLAITVPAFAAVVYGLSTWTVVETRLESAAMVEDEDLAIVRAASPGFLAEVVVTSGQRVAAGDVLARLENHELRAELARQQNLARQLEAKKRRSVFDQDPAAASILEEQLAVVRRRVEQAERRVRDLTVVAPGAGTVDTGELDRFDGNWFARGAALVMLTPGEGKVLKALVSERDVERYRQQVGGPVGVFLPGRREQLRVGTLRRVSPGATTSVDFPLLTAMAGGPLSIRDGDPPRLAEPYFEADVSIDGALPDRLGAGERGYVYLSGQPSSLFDLARQALGSFVEATLQRVEHPASGGPS